MHRGAGLVDGDLGARAEGGQAGEPALAVDRLHSPRQRAPRDAAHAPVAAHPGRPADPGLREGLAGLHQRRHPRGDEGVEVDPGRRDGRDPGQDQPVVGGCGDQVGLAARDVGGAARLRVVGRVGGDHHHLSAGVLDRDLPHAVVGGDLRGRRAGRRQRVRGGGVAGPVGQRRTAEPLDLVPAAGDGELETGPRAAVLPAVGRAQGVELAVEGRRLLGVESCGCRAAGGVDEGRGARRARRCSSAAPGAPGPWGSGSAAPWGSWWASRWASWSGSTWASRSASRTESRSGSSWAPRSGRSRRCRSGRHGAP